MEPTPKLERLRVLIVDDNPHMAQIVKTVLRGFGINDLLEARDAESAWERLNVEPVDLVVLDRVLRCEDGLDLVRRVRQATSGVNPYLPIIMLSANTSRQMIEEARDAGATEFCCKPITVRDLFGKLSAVIDRPRSFVRTANFFGPDRRRRDSSQFDGENRRQDAVGAA